MTRLLCAIALATVAGCATTAAEVCGTTPDGDEFCAIYQVRTP